MKRFLQRSIFIVAIIITSGCATVKDNGPLATEANVIASVQTAAALGQTLWQAGKLKDADAVLAITAFRAIQQNLQAYNAAIAAGNKAGAAVYLRLAADGLDALMLQLSALQKG